MPLVKKVDTFLEKSSALLEVSPSETLVSITYHGDEAGSYIAFKTYEPSSGVCYRYKTRKSKDLSRILSSLGPKGAQFTKKKIKDEYKVAKGQNLDKNQVEEYTTSVAGFASLMSNTEPVEEPVEEPPKESKPEAEKSGKKKSKKSKKKGKK